MRGLDKRFLDTMREKLDQGRRRGYVGWDRRWENCSFPSDPTGPHGTMMRRLREEVAELTIAVHSGNPDDIRKEAADVANFAMFIADIEGTLDTDNGKDEC